MRLWYYKWGSHFKSWWYRFTIILIQEGSKRLGAAIPKATRHVTLIPVQDNSDLLEGQHCLAHPSLKLLHVYDKTEKSDRNICVGSWSISVSSIRCNSRWKYAISNQEQNNKQFNQVTFYRKLPTASITICKHAWYISQMSKSTSITLPLSQMPKDNSVRKCCTIWW